jgi:gluconokinase
MIARNPPAPHAPPGDAPPSGATPAWIVVMGVAGSGKTSVGQAAADAIGVPLIEGDAFHSAENVAKMRSGHPLDDADRAGWLDRLADELAAHPGGAVLACSALKRAYRDRLRRAVPDLRFAFLALTREQALERVAARSGHYMPPSLVDSQFKTLESPIGEPGVLPLDGTWPVEQLAARIAQAVGVGDTPRR